MKMREKTTYVDTSRPPNDGDTCYGDFIGKTPFNNRFIWLKCPHCGRARWVRIIRGRPKTKRCVRCRQTCDTARHKTGDGYIVVSIKRTDFFRTMATKTGHILEHRLVMAKHLKRCLLPWEIVHHKNGIKDDNRLENLMLVTGQYNHVPDTELKRYVHRLERRVRELEDILDVCKYELHIDN